VRGSPDHEVTSHRGSGSLMNREGEVSDNLLGGGEKERRFVKRFLASPAGIKREKPGKLLTKRHLL
jgi:hypothetical protein